MMALPANRLLYKKNHTGVLLLNLIEFDEGTKFEFLYKLSIFAIFGLLQVLFAYLQ